MHRLVYRPQHANASASGDVYEHVLVAEAALGRLMPPWAEVHHVDENPRNNAPSNLVICQNRAYHKLLHVRARIRRAGGNPNTEKICATCKRVLPLECFSVSRSDKVHGRQSACRECAKAYNRTYVRPEVSHAL